MIVMRKLLVLPISKRNCGTINGDKLSWQHRYLKYHDAEHNLKVQNMQLVQMVNDKRSIHLEMKKKN